MSRYANELIVSKSPEQMGATVQQYMTQQGFALKNYSDGMQVWQKGGGWVAAPQFIRVMVRPGAVKLEAWLKTALLPGVYVGEMGLDGFYGFALKSVLKGRVAELERLLAG